MALIRYPGSKEKLAPKIFALTPFNIAGGLFSYQDSWEYREPFFGCGALGFRILPKLPRTSKIWLNDLDRGIYSLWLSVKDAPDELSKLIQGFTPEVEAFRQFKAEDGCLTTDFVVAGFQKLALHRMSYSGYGFKSGSPLGGWNQKNPTYNVKCRWNPANLVKEVYKLHRVMTKFGKNLRITCVDYKKVLRDAPKRCFIYLDPPYVKAGPALYKYSFESKAQHRELSNKIAELECPWALSYDDHRLIRRLYSDIATFEELETTYTNAKSKGNRPKNREILLRPVEDDGTLDKRFN